MSGPSLGELNITVNAGDSEAKVRSLNSSLDQLARKERERAGAAYADRFQTDAQAQAMGRAETRAYELAKAMEAGGTATGVHGLQLGRLNMELGTAIGRFTGLNTAATRLTGQIGGAVTGYGAMIAILGGVTAGLEVWKVWHEEESKAREEQDKLTESLDKWYKKQKEGAAGEFPAQIEAMTAKVKELHKSLDDMMAGKFFAAVDAVGAGGSKLNAWLRILTAGDATAIATQASVEIAKAAAVKAKGIKDGQAAIDAAAKEAADRFDKAAKEARGKALSAEIALFQAGLAGPNGVAKMQDEITKYAQMAAQFAAAGDVSHAIEYAEAAKKLTDALKPLNDAIKANWEAMKTNALQVMREEAIAIVTKTEATEKQTKAITDNVVAMQKQLAERFKQQSQTAAQITAADDAAKRKQEQYDLQMRQDWIRGIDSIITHGLTSFSNFFDSVLQMFRKMLADMEKAGKGDSIGAKLLGLGSAAIGGGLAGYQIGQSSGSGAAGFLGGAASGALAGSAFGVPGAIVGGLAGAAGGLMGASKAQNDAAEQLRLAALALQAQAGAFINASRSGNSVVDALGANDATVAGLLKAGGFNPSSGRTAHAKYTGADIEAAGARNAQRIADDFWSGIAASLNALDGPQGDYLNQIRDIEKQYEANRTAALALNATQAQLAEIEDLRTGNLKKLADAMQLATQRDFDDLNVRHLKATGQGSAADDAAFRNAQLREYQDAKAAGKDPLYLALLTQTQVEEAMFRAEQIANDKMAAQYDTQIQTAQDALAVNQQQLQAQLQTIQETQRVVDTLAEFSRGLKLNSQLTTLSPTQQLVEARKQFDAIAAQALTGNRDAAGNLPSAANAYLTASRGVNASGLGYVADFQRVQSAVERTQNLFGAQLSAEQQFANSLRTQSDLLSRQIALLQDAKNQRTAMIDAIRQGISVSADGSVQVIAGQDRMRNELVAAISSLADAIAVRDNR